MCIKSARAKNVFITYQYFLGNNVRKENYSTRGIFKKKAGLG